MEAAVLIEKMELPMREYLTSNISLRELATKYNLSRQMLSGFMLGRGVDIYSKKSNVNNYAFESIKTEEQAYWLGFLYADGCVRHYKSSKSVELTLQEQDYDHLVKFARFIDYGGDIKYREKQKAYRISFGSAKMHDDLVKLGCMEKKSLVLRFPSKENIPSDLLCHFIRGYFDGDGHLDIHHTAHHTFRKTISLLGTKEFLTALLSVLPFSVRGVDIIKKCKNNNSNNYYFSLRKAESALFLDYIYKDATVYLTRKYLNYIA